jgi:uncharacterized protein with ATP-grasp and redox domains
MEGGTIVLIQPDCIPCILRMSIKAIRKLDFDGSAMKELCGSIMEIPALRGTSWDITSAEIVERVWKKITNRTENKDPFYSEKSAQNNRMMDLYPFLKDLVGNGPDPLLTAVKLSILGNAMDAMMSEKRQDMENLISRQLEMPLSGKMYEEFVGCVKESGLLLFFGDNSGEIVLDKLLIETIKERHDVDVVFVVRSMPILNDATLEEARHVGIGEIATIVENGMDGTCPGTVLARCSKEVHELVQEADWIISKGGGNFDTLDEEKKRGLAKPVSFMLFSKCDPYAEYLGVEQGLPILAHYS